MHANGSAVSFGKSMPVIIVSWRLECPLKTHFTTSSAKWTTVSRKRTPKSHFRQRYQSFTEPVEIKIIQHDVCGVGRMINNSVVQEKFLMEIVA